MSKRKNMIYKIVVGLLAVMFTFGGISNLFGFEDAELSLTTLGYPLYFGKLLGAFQLIAVAGLLVPKIPRIKEYIYLGLLTNLISALVSHIVVEGLVPLVFIISALIALTSYAFYLLKTKSRKETVLACSS